MFDRTINLQVVDEYVNCDGLKRHMILSHADYLSDQYPRRSRLEHALYACDELCGFLTACAMLRPQ
ncbi:MAG: hypothetical protein ACKN9S_04860 [Pirellula sp.]